MGIIGSILRRRDGAGGFRTVDGGHPAPYPDMTDEQLYNYEIAFKVPRKTFDRPPVPAAPETTVPRQEHGEMRTDRWAEERTEMRTETQADARTEMHGKTGRDKVLHSTRFNARRERAEPQPEMPAADAEQSRMAPQQANTAVVPGTLDLSRPVRLVTTKQPVEIITTRARHPVYKVHGYIGDADIATVFTLDGQLSENGPCFLENVPEQHELHLNIYLNDDPAAAERYRITQHATREQAAAAAADRVACVEVQFDL